MNRSWTQYEGQIVAEQFCLRQFLGASSQGAVFLTERSATDSQKAAIKLLPAESVDAEGQLSRWISAASLSHPNLLQIFQTGRCRLDNVEFLYALTEHAEENLAQIILQRPLSADEARDMLDPVLDALLYLHGKGFVHGSIKPANIMAAGDKVKISSDSIRLAVSSGTTGNISTANLSAPNISAYDPPERATAGFSPAADVWSLGMTLVEVLTQRLPVWNPADQREPQLPESSAVPQPFLDIVRNSLVRDRARRWTLGEIAARLQLNYQPTLSATDSSLSAIPMPSSQTPQQNLPRRESRQAKQSRAASPRYIIPGVAAALVLAVLAIPKFFNQHSAERSGEAKAAAAAAQLPVPAPVKSRGKINSQSAALSAAKTTRPTAKSNATVATASPVPTALHTEEKKSPAVNPVRGAVLHEVLPDVSSKARDTIHGTVKISVRAHVNPAGAVTAADLSGVVPSKYFADLALKASREWTFQSPESAGHSLSSEWVLHYYFTPSSTRAVPEQVAP